MQLGQNMMLEAAIKLLLSRLEIEPETVKSGIAQITQIMAEHQGTQRQILADLAAIKERLGLTDETDDGRRHSSELERYIAERNRITG